MTPLVSSTRSRQQDRSSISKKKTSSSTTKFFNSLDPGRPITPHSRLAQSSFQQGRRTAWPGTFSRPRCTSFARAYAGLSFTHLPNAFQAGPSAKRRSSGPSRPPAKPDEPMSPRSRRTGRWACALLLDARTNPHRTGTGNRPRCGSVLIPWPSSARRAARAPHHLLRIDGRALSPFDPYSFCRVRSRGECAPATLRGSHRVSHANHGPPMHEHIRAIAVFAWRWPIGAMKRAPWTRPNYRVRRFPRPPPSQFDPNAVALFRKAAKRRRHGLSARLAATHTPPHQHQAARARRACARHRPRRLDACRDIASF